MANTCSINARKNNRSLERKSAYKHIFRVKQRTIFYFSESQKPLYSEAEQIESAPSKRGCYLGLGCGIGWQNKKNAFISRQTPRWLLFVER